MVSFSIIHLVHQEPHPQPSLFLTHIKKGLTNLEILICMLVYQSSVNENGMSQIQTHI